MRAGQPLAPRPDFGPIRTRVSCVGNPKSPRKIAAARISDGYRNGFDWKICRLQEVGGEFQTELLQKFNRALCERFLESFQKGGSAHARRRCERTAGVR